MSDDERQQAAEVAELESLGAAWARRSDAYLVGYTTVTIRPVQFHSAPTIEMQRRLMVAVIASSASADNFAAQAVNLNQSIRTYTVAMFVLAAVQIILALLR